MENAKCATCRFYSIKTDREYHAWIDEHGFKREQTRSLETRMCRRFPQDIAHYPDDWCGEYEHKEPSK